MLSAPARSAALNSSTEIRFSGPKALMDGLVVHSGADVGLINGGPDSPSSQELPDPRHT